MLSCKRFYCFAVALMLLLAVTVERRPTFPLAEAGLASDEGVHQQPRRTTSSTLSCNLKFRMLEIRPALCFLTFLREMLAWFLICQSPAAASL